MAATLDSAWVASLVTASATVAPVLAGSAVVEFTIAKTERAVVEIVDGRVVGPVDDDRQPDVSLPVTAEQLAEFTSGSVSMSQAYMRGDLKPVGSTGALLAVLGLFDDEGFRLALA